VNIIYYRAFLHAAQLIPFKRMKFIDESHFKSKGKVHLN
jgi:hypothetical protein